MNVAIIPAKGFSSRIPRKNIRMFHGKPIIEYSIRAAQDSRLFGSVLVSTDDDMVAEVAMNCGADVMRRGERWTRDDVGPLDVARHTLELMSDVTLACVIYATAPLMAVGDLTIGYRAMQRPGVCYAFSAGSVPFLHDAAQFFWCHPWALKERVPEFGGNTVMVPIARERDCDINTFEDMQRAEMMYAALYPQAVAA